ncbi:putative Fructokinase [Burkholderia multivorans]
MSAAFPSFVSAGDILTDMVRTACTQWTSVPGGAGWNVARAVAQAATLYADGEIHDALPPRVDVADTVGAGDASIGGLLFSLMSSRQRGWRAHLAFALAAGAAACRRTAAPARMRRRSTRCSRCCPPTHEPLYMLRRSDTMGCPIAGEASWTRTSSPKAFTRPRRTPVKPRTGSSRAT